MDQRLSADQHFELARASWRAIEYNPSANGHIVVFDRTKGLKGDTHFFRHDLSYQKILDYAARLHALIGQTVTILCAGGSIGAEAYSLAYMGAKRGYDSWLRVQTFDYSRNFTNIADFGIYPAFMRFACEPEKADLLEHCDRDYVRVRDAFRRHVEVLPPMDMRDIYKSGHRCDMVISHCALMYFNGGPELDRAILGLAQTARHMLVVDETIPDRLLPQLRSDGRSYHRVEHANGHAVLSTHRGLRA